MFRGFFELGDLKAEGSGLSGPARHIDRYPGHEVRV